MTEIRVPTLGESVTEATIGRWFKKAGDAVAVDEPLVELETDKVTIEVPAPSAGTLGDIVAKDGETVAVGALLGQINDGAAGAAAKPPAAPAKAAAPPPPPSAAPAPAAATSKAPPADAPLAPGILSGFCMMRVLTESWNTQPERASRPFSKDRDGFVLWYKRLEAGVFKLPRVEAGRRSVELRASELAMVLDGIDMTKLKRVPRYGRGAEAGRTKIGNREKEEKIDSTKQFVVS